MTIGEAGNGKAGETAFPTPDAEQRAAIFLSTHKGREVIEGISGRSGELMDVVGATAYIRSPSGIEWCSPIERISPA